MRLLHKTRVRRWTAGIVLVAFLNLSTGCCAIFGGTSQTLRLVTNPEGKTVYYQGMKLKDGDTFTVSKHWEAPQLNVGTDRRPVMYDMHYDPNPWLIGDGVLLLFLIIPGLIGLGVDFGTGAWRNIDNPQQVYVPPEQ